MVAPWREHEPLAAHTTLAVGGPASYLATVTTIEELHQTVVLAQALALPFVVLGGGSNVLARDQGFPGLVIVMAIPGMTQSSKGDRVLVTAGAGLLFDDVVAETVRLGYWGLENLSHIPGTVGATPIQNVGAYGVEVSDVIQSVTVYDTETHQVQELANHECAFGYRTSRFKVAAKK